MSTPLTGSCFSSESAQGPSIMGFEDERDNLYRGLVVSSNGRSKRTCELISSIGPRGTSFLRGVDLGFSPIMSDPGRFSCGCRRWGPGPQELGAINPSAVQDDGQPAR